MKNLIKLECIKCGRIDRMTLENYIEVIIHQSEHNNNYKCAYGCGEQYFKLDISEVQKTM